MTGWKIRFNNDFFIHIISIEIYCFHIEMQNEVVKCFVLIGTGANCDKYKLILNKFWVLITNNSKIFNKCTNGVLSHTRDTGQVENLCYILFRYHFLLDSFFLKVLDNMFDTYNIQTLHSTFFYLHSSANYYHFHHNCGQENMKRNQLLRYTIL